MIVLFYGTKAQEELKQYHGITEVCGRTTMRRVP